MYMHKPAPHHTNMQLTKYLMVLVNTFRFTYEAACKRALQGACMCTHPLESCSMWQHFVGSLEYRISLAKEPSRNSALFR